MQIRRIHFEHTLIMESSILWLFLSGVCLDSSLALAFPESNQPRQQFLHLSPHHATLPIPTTPTSSSEWTSRSSTSAGKNGILPSTTTPYWLPNAQPCWKFYCKNKGITAPSIKVLPLLSSSTASSRPSTASRSKATIFAEIVGFYSGGRQTESVTLPPPLSVKLLSPWTAIRAVTRKNATVITGVSTEERKNKTSKTASRTHFNLREVIRPAIIASPDVRQTLLPFDKSYRDSDHEIPRQRPGKTNKLQLSTSRPTKHVSRSSATATAAPAKSVIESVSQTLDFAEHWSNTSKAENVSDTYDSGYEKLDDISFYRTQNEIQTFILNASSSRNQSSFSKISQTVRDLTAEMVYYTNKFNTTESESSSYWNMTTSEKWSSNWLIPAPTEEKMTFDGKSCGTKVIGYYTSWGTRDISRKTLSYLTHINYAFADLAANRTVPVWLKPSSAARLQHLVDLRGSATTPKISLSVGGWGSAENFAVIVRNETTLSAFLDGLFLVVKRYNLDGIDIDWEYPGAEEKELYVTFLRKVRIYLELWKTILDKEHLLLTFAGAAGAESLHAGFDIKSLLEGTTVDWVNVMSYDFYGPWAGPTGEYTGPISPLYYAAPRNYSRTLNTHWAIEQYICQSSAPHKIMLGVPFYGRYWNNVGDSVNGDPMWRKVEGDIVTGGHESYNSIATNFIKDANFRFYYSDTAKAAYAWNAAKKIYLGFESPKCADLKAQYVLQNGLGGVMIWAVDLDDDNSTLLKALTNENSMCTTRRLSLPKAKFVCRETHWWTALENVNNSGMCGRMAPLLKGTYAVCDPEDLSAPCCGQWGYCGSGPAYCDCPTCVDYGRSPELVSRDAVKPTINITLWHTMDSPDRGKCGYFASKIDNTTFAICNPDDATAPCCSLSGFCGVGEDFCACPDCVDFRKTPDYRYKVLPYVEKQWWTWEDGPDKAGQCGANAPKFNGSDAICDPYAANAHCCSAFGYCGASDDHCLCPTCRDFSKIF